MSSLRVDDPTAVQEEADAEISLEKRFFNVQTFISFGIALAILVFLFTRFDIDFNALWNNARRSDPFLYALAFLLFYVTFPMRGIRWRLLLRNAGFHAGEGVALPSLREITEILFLGWFGNCVIPAKLGDAYRGYLMKKKAQISFSKTFGTIFAERILDMLILFGLLMAAALSVFSSSSRGPVSGILEVGFAMAAVIAIGLLAMKRLGGRIEGFLPKRFRGAYGRFQEGTMASFGQLPLVIFISVLIWLFEAGRLFLVTQALGVPVGFALIVFVALAHSLLTAIPFTPGGLGLAEAGMVGLLTLAIAPESAISIAILDRVLSYWSIIFLGFIVFALTRRKY